MKGATPHYVFSEHPVLQIHFILTTLGLGGMKASLSSVTSLNCAQIPAQALEQ